MTQDEIDLYWDTARKNVSKSWGFEASKELAYILGIEYPQAEHCTKLELTPQLKRQLEMLAGPNWKFAAAILKSRREEV